MITLFIDTSASDVSIALLKDNKIVTRKVELENGRIQINYAR